MEECIKVTRPEFKQCLVPQKERSCGSCSMCCKFFAIPEVNKSPEEWCKYCRPGKGGCTIYANRPKVCQDFECWWKGDIVDDEWYPARSKMVLHSRGICKEIMVKVDPSFPNAWRKEPYYSQLLEWSYTDHIFIGIGRTEIYLRCGIERNIPYDYEKQCQAAEKKFLETGCSAG
jgi:hypothetical protein